MFPTITGTYRPNAPWQHTRNDLHPPPNLAWHHVVPFATLRNVWNVLVNTGRDSHLPDARVALRQYLVLCGQTPPAADGWIDRMRAETLDRPDCDFLASCSVWPPWNIVEGPQFRSDDPGDHYIDRYTHGLTLREFGRMPAMETLFLEFTAFGFAGANPPPAALRAVREAITLARGPLACTDPIPYREDMWERDHGGRWRKRRTGVRFIAG